jgi:hypothetical protein
MIRAPLSFLFYKLSEELMAIVTKKLKVRAAADGESTSTHFRNETTKAPEDSKQTLLNHMEPETLIDPEDTTDDQGSTHFQNDTTYSEKTNRMNASTKAKKTTAAPTKKHAPVPLAKQSAKKHPAKTRANNTVDAPGTTQAMEGDDFPADEVEADVDCDEEVGQQDTQHMDNDIDPAAGYLTVGGELEDDFDDDEDEIDAGSELDVDSGSTPQSLLEVGDEDDDWDEESIEVVSEFDDEDEEDGEPDESEEPEEGEIEASTVLSADDMPVVDVDGTDDEGDDAVFASVGRQVHVIKANRIVASIGKKRAVKAGHGDTYMSDQFQEVVYVEMSKHGLRAGLAKMGFALATINVTKNDVINKRVEAKAKKVTAAVRRTTQSSNEALGQCLAIAAVGINRQYFKDARNELRAALEDELEAAGVRGASRLIRRIFASKGVDYAKSILTLANKLVGMPEVTRNQFAAALDMTTDGEIDDDEDEFGEDAEPEFVTAEDADAEFDDDFEDEIESPETVHAALQRPAAQIRQRRSEVNASAAGYSVNAMAVLSGKAPLPFI